MAMTNASVKMSTEKLVTQASSLLHQNKGLFVGEGHDNLSAKLFLLQNLERFKRQGVHTLYVELDNASLQALAVDVNCFKEHTNGIQSKSTIADKMIIDKAHALGMRVIGSDDVIYEKGRFNKMRGDGVLADTVGLSYNAMDRRNAYAAALIERTKGEGKFIVFGGAQHAGQEIKVPSGKGLDERLGIPHLKLDIESNKKGSFRTTSISSLEDVKGLVEKNAPSSQKDVVLAGQQQLSPVSGKIGLNLSISNEFGFAAPHIASLTDNERLAVNELAEKARKAGICKPSVYPDQKMILDNDDLAQIVAGAQAKKLPSHRAK